MAIRPHFCNRVVPTSQPHKGRVKRRKSGKAAKWFYWCYWEAFFHPYREPTLIRCLSSWISFLYTMFCPPPPPLSSPHVLNCSTRGGFCLERFLWISPFQRTHAVIITTQILEKWTGMLVCCWIMWGQWSWRMMDWVIDWKGQNSAEQWFAYATSDLGE